MVTGVRLFSLFVLGAALLAGQVPANASAPPSWELDSLAPLSQVPEQVLPPLTAEQIAEVEANAAGGKELQVAVPMKVDLRPGEGGLWEDLPNGDRLWRLRIRARGDLWTVAGFRTWRMQDGGELYLWQQDRGRARGPFGHEAIRSHGQLWIPPLEGESFVLELLWPAALEGEEPKAHLGTLTRGYKPWGGFGEPGGGPGIDSGACNNDVNCPLGNNWQDEKRGVVNLLNGSGGGYCSGSLITNTAGDCRNLVLTANHCLNTQSEAASTQFQFNFERPQCNAGTAPTDQVVSGSTWLASYGPSDFTLLEMDVAPPEAYAVYYNGWTRSTVPATESWCIHHPNNDEKAITYNADPLVDGQNYGPDHWRVTEWEDGTTEPGSSGSPMFDQNHRIVGQLHGGTASCTSITYDEFGKVDISWEGGGTPSSRLRDWLDPGNTGAVTSDGIDAAVCRVPQPKLAYQGHTIDDSAGNGDGVLDPGETAILPVTTLNSGTLDATQVTGALSTSTPLVTIADANASWPDLPIGAALESIAPHFTVETDPAFVCGDTILFHLDYAAAENPGAWASEFTVGTGTKQVNNLYQDDMEAGVGTWVPSTLQGTNAWSQSTTDAFSPTHSWFVDDISSVSDAVLMMEELPNLPAGAELRFHHNIDSESGFDGGVLEYTTDGATWVDAGSLITLGGYNSTIDSGFSSPLAGRNAWSGNLGGWAEVAVDLSSLAGSNVRFRWRFATDSSVSAAGWYLDDVTVDQNSWICNSPVALPGEASEPGVGAPFTIDKDPGGFLLAWSAPAAGGPVDRYSLYRHDLAAGPPALPVCEADLGTGTSAVLATLPGGNGFLVVARNSAGEGGYGTDSDGISRQPAAGADVCP